MLNKILNPGLNPRSPRRHPPSRALIAQKNSGVHKSGTDISNYSSRILFIARPRAVPGRVVVNGSSGGTGEKHTQRPKFLGRRKVKYTTRRIL
jgi:hypothetical protein